MEASRANAMLGTVVLQLPFALGQGLETYSPRIRSNLQGGWIWPRKAPRTERHCAALTCLSPSPALVPVLTLAAVGLVRGARVTSGCMSLGMRGGGNGYLQHQGARWQAQAPTSKTLPTPALGNSEAQTKQWTLL